MKRALAAISAAGLLIISEHRLPAPIQEVPTPTPEKSTTKREGAESNSLARFNGTWRYTSNNGTYTLVLSNGNTAEWSAQSTGRLGNRKSWPTSVLPGNYNTIPEVSEKISGKTTEVKIEGSRLTINWSPTSKKIVDWSPKSIPYEVMANSSQFRPKLGTELYTLSGNVLLRTSQNGKTDPFVRIK